MSSDINPTCEVCSTAVLTPPKHKRMPTPKLCTACRKARSKAVLEAAKQRAREALNID